MTNQIVITLKDFIRSLSTALDLLTMRLTKHHQRVTLICLKLAEALNLSKKEKLLLFYAGLLHDFGVTSSKDKLAIMQFDYTNSQMHTQTGWSLLRKNKYFEEVAEIIRYHHDRWLGPNSSGLLKDSIPILSQIIYLSDRFEVLISPDEYILNQRERITNQITKFIGMWFNPQLGGVLKKISRPDGFWLDLTSEYLSNILDEIAPTDDRTITLDEVTQISQIFSELIDLKSRYTQTHSQGVTELAIKLAKQLGWSENDLKYLRIAALLHDLGKLSVPDEVLEKPTFLKPIEYALIKKHPYYTYRVLKSIKGFEGIAEWAASHHERLDGNGYPFGLSNKALSIGARIIAIADIFTALNEERPYRSKLPASQVFNILNQSASGGAIDSQILETLKSIYPI